MPITAGATSVLASAVIPVAYYRHQLTTGMMCAVAAVVVAAGALDQIAQVAVLPALVSDDQLGLVSGQSELILNLTAVAGLLLAAGRLAAPFVVYSASFGLLALAAGRIRNTLDPPPPDAAGRWRGRRLPVRWHQGPDDAQPCEGVASGGTGSGRVPLVATPTAATSSVAAPRTVQGRSGRLAGSKAPRSFSQTYSGVVAGSWPHAWSPPGSSAPPSSCR